ncbi:MAG TPA: GntR family transcriptional regulator [Burkholderiaceae bacterium]|nr:GntR family transcriptional regulator [Burkholderiaceae bacterium]
MGEARISDMLLTDQAFLAIKALLFDGEVHAGQLVSMAELVKRSGLPLAPVREAVKRAEAVGLVEILPKRGVQIMAATPDTIQACFHLRCLIDQEGARVLASNITKDAIEALRDEHIAVREGAVKAVTPDIQRLAKKVDWELHSTLAGALNNNLAAQIYDSNRDRITVLQQSRHFLPERIVPAMTEHLRIIDAILTGQTQEAMTAVRQHMVGTLRWWGVAPPEGNVPTSMRTTT